MRTIILGIVLLSALAACDAGGTGPVGGSSAAEQACVLGVTRETNRPDVVVLGSGRAETGTLVRLGVGPTRAPWQCVAYADGTVGEIASITDEGVL